MKKTGWLLALIAVSTLGYGRTPASVSHIHGIALSSVAGQTEQLVLGAHDGVYTLSQDGTTQRVSSSTDDYMSFVGDGNQANVIYASGHPQAGGNLGLLKSVDAGKTWQHISDGLNGPVDFHLLALDPTNSDRIYGDMQGLQTTSDGGKTWKKGGTLPQGTYSFAVSGIASSRLYAASDSGLSVSDNDGMSWKSVTTDNFPATLVHTTADGKLYAFVAGKGLMAADEKALEWRLLNNQFGQRVPLSMAQSSVDGAHLVMKDHANSIWESFDGGVTWDYFIAEKKLSATETLGKSVYRQYCAACHNPLGTGESYSESFWTVQDYIGAPTMDPPGHSWHHTDEQLTETIAFGSPRTGKMPAWKDILSAADISNVIAYIKSMWTQRELDCQGPKHMSCM